MNPLVFFAIAIIIDLFLKSSKDKKKIEKARKKRNEQIKRQPIEKKESIITVLNKELERRIDRSLETRPSDENEVKDLRNSREEISNNIIHNKVLDTKKYDGSEIGTKRDIREDILRGIIFSEILSEPKGRQHMKRSM